MKCYHYKLYKKECKKHENRIVRMAGSKARGYIARR